MRFWNARTGVPLRPPFRHDDRIHAVAFSPDGRRILTAGQDGTARLWQVPDGTPLATLRGHAGPVIDLAFSPDGQTIVTGSGDKTARLWEAATATLRSELRGHRGAVAVAFHPSGKVVLTGALDETARLWDAATGQAARRADADGRVGPARILQSRRPEHSAGRPVGPLVGCRDRQAGRQTAAGPGPDSGGRLQP